MAGIADACEARYEMPTYGLWGQKGNEAWRIENVSHMHEIRAAGFLATHRRQRAPTRRVMKDIYISLSPLVAGECVIAI